jgi:DNA-binding NarL/FixJ family response regulator
MGKKEFLDAVTQDSFDVALIDMSVGERESGFEILRFLQDKNIQLPAIIFSAHDDFFYALKCLKAGAKGYIGKGNMCADLVRGLKEVLQGNLFVSGAEGKIILEQYKKYHAGPVNSLKSL